jgi:hypothetical protein
MRCEKARSSNTQRLWRGLAFEQMESRLALSATTGIDTAEVAELQFDRDAFLAAWQGGFVDLDTRGFSNFFSYNGTGLVRQYVAFAESQSGSLANADTINLRDWIQFEGTLGAYDSDSFTSIPQPTVGPAKPNGGMIAIGEIFAAAPLLKMGHDVHISQAVRDQYEPAETNHIEFTERLSLSRARDMYLEVAARVNHDDIESKDHLGSSNITIAEEQLVADEEINQEAESESIAALVARGRSLPAAQNALPSEAVEIRDVAKPLRDAPSMTQSPESENKTEKTDRPKQVSQTEVRDQVFQAWRDSKLDAMKRSPGRPEEEEQDDTASWPVLAALAVGGLVFSSRRLTNPAPTHQLPPRRQKLGNILPSE